MDYGALLDETDFAPELEEQCDGGNEAASPQVERKPAKEPVDREREKKAD